MIKKIYDGLQRGLIVVAVVVAIFMGAAKLLHISPHIVFSGSMEPEIPTGSLCFIDEKQRKAEKGDVLAFSKGSLLITHRVMEVVDGGYVTKGDNNPTTDIGMVKQEEVLGKNVFWIPAAGYAVAFLQSLKGIIVVGTLLGVFLLGGMMLPESKGKGGQE